MQKQFHFIMASIKSPLSRIFLAVGLSFIAFSPTVSLETVSLEVAQHNANNDSIRFVQPNTAAPGPSRRTAAQLRCCPCGCPDHYPTALVPANLVGLTVAAYPTFLLYLPQTTPQGSCTTASRGNTTPSIEVALDDESGNEVYAKTFSSIHTSGIVNFSFSPNDNIPPLEIGKNYQWSIDIICDVEDRSGDYSVYGWIQRVEPTATLKAALEKAPPERLPEIYAAAGIWNDTIIALAALRRSQPNNASLAAQWANLLKMVGLETLSEKPLVDCCQIEK